MSELKHFGINGMKWGVRRYQNEDGSLTELGRMHYNYSYAKKDRADIQKRNRSDREYTYKNARKDRKQRAAITVGLALTGAVIANKYLNLNPGSNSAGSQTSNGGGSSGGSSLGKMAVTAVALAPVIDAGYNFVKDIRDRKKRELDNKPYVPMDLSQLTTQELNDAVNRKNAEQRYYESFGVKDISADERRKYEVWDNATKGLSVAQKAESFAKMYKSTRTGKVGGEQQEKKK